MFFFDLNWQIQHFLNQFFWQINFLLLVILVILGYLAYKKPVYAIGLTITLLPTYLLRSKIWFLPLTFLELCIWVTFFGWLVNRLTANRQQLTENKKRSTVDGQRLTAYWLPIILILIAATISIFIAPDLRAAAGLWKAYFIEPILFFLILINVTQSEKDKKIILWSLGISTLIISLLAILQKFTGFGIAEPGWVAAEHRRVTSIFTSPNAVGLYLGPILAIYFGWLIPDLQKTKFRNSIFWREIILKLIIIIPALFAIFFTVSQGTWLGLAAAIVFLAYFGWNKKWTATAILLLIILIFILPIARDKIWPIITFQDQAGQNRLILLQMSRQYLLTSPKKFIFGAGILGFAQIQNQIREPLKMEALLYPHNIFFNFWLEIGLLGLFAFTWLIVKFFKTGFRQPTTNSSQPERWLQLGIMAAMVVIVIHGLIDVPYFKNDLAILFWIIIGLI